MLNLLIPDYPLSEFQKLTAQEIKQLKCCALTDNGEYLCTVIVPGTDYIKLQAEYNGQLSNSVAGKELADIKPEFKCETCGKAFENKLQLTGHNLSHKRETVKT